MPCPFRNHRRHREIPLAVNKIEDAALHNQKKKYYHVLLCTETDTRKVYRWKDPQTHTLDRNRCLCSAEQTLTESLLLMGHYTNRHRRCISSVQSEIGILCVVGHRRSAIHTKQRGTNN